MQQHIKIGISSSILFFINAVEKENKIDLTNFLVTLQNEEVLSIDVILKDLCSSGSTNIKVIYEIQSELLRLNILDIREAENTKKVRSDRLW